MKPAFDLFSLAGIGRRNKNRADKKYANFNRRIIASTIDLFFVMVIIGPLFELAFNYFYPPVMVDWPQVQALMKAQSDQQVANGIVVKALIKAGYIRRWIVDSAVQSCLLLGLTGLCWHYWSATPGKMLAGIKVADAVSEAPLSTAQIIARLAGYVVSCACLFIGFFWINFDKRCQGWHDKLARSVVLVQPWNTHPLYKAYQLFMRQISRHHQERNE